MSAQSEREYSSPSSSRGFTSLRKTDLLDILGSGRDMDSDRWSVAATLDDRESEYSYGKGPGKSVSSSAVGDEKGREEEMLTDTTEGMDEEEDEDRESRFEEEEEEAGGRPHYEQNGDISAPGQPQPSFLLNKTYQELVEENELLHSRLLNLQLSQQKQLSSPTKVKNASLDGKGSSSDSSVATAATATTIKKISDLTSTLHNLILAIAQAHPPNLEKTASFMTSHFPGAHPQLTSVAPFVLEKLAFDALLQYFLSSLPFGGSNHQVLNAAYTDQLERFRRTLGTDAARWHRRSTVQSLAVDPATRAYLQEMRAAFTTHVKGLVNELFGDASQIDLERCAGWAEELSIEMHSGEVDISTHLGDVGGEEVVVVAEIEGKKGTRMVLSPLFVDDNGAVVVPARVVLF